MKDASEQKGTIRTTAMPHILLSISAVRTILWICQLHNLLNMFPDAKLSSPIQIPILQHYIQTWGLECSTRIQNRLAFRLEQQVYEYEPWRPVRHVSPQLTSVPWNRTSTCSTCDTKRCVICRACDRPAPARAFVIIIMCYKRTSSARMCASSAERKRVSPRDNGFDVSKFGRSDFQTLLTIKLQNCTWLVCVQVTTGFSYRCSWRQKYLENERVVEISVPPDSQCLLRSNEGLGSFRSSGQEAVHCAGAKSFLYVVSFMSTSSFLVNSLLQGSARRWPTLSSFMVSLGTHLAGFVLQFGPKQDITWAMLSGNRKTQDAVLNLPWAGRLCLCTHHLQRGTRSKTRRKTNKTFKTVPVKTPLLMLKFEKRSALRGTRAWNPGRKKRVCVSSYPNRGRFWKPRTTVATYATLYVEKSRRSLPRAGRKI